MAEEDFTEEDFEDLPPVPGPTQRVIRNTAPIKKQQQQPQLQPQQPVQPPATRDVAIPKDKYGIYSIPPRMGVFDNELQKPIIEESEITSVLLALLVKVANDVDEMKSRI